MARNVNISLGVPGSANSFIGSDLMLINLAREAFEAASWPTSINTGRYMFPLGDNTRNVAVVETAEAKDSFLEKQGSIIAASKL